MSLLKVENVGKAFYSYKSEWIRFARWFGFKAHANSATWVLKDISFEVDKGEAVGIIGVNGTGKSTLLKLITGTLIPSKGKITVNGRISAMLELGMGFNPDLTGRNNVVHAAGMMGFSTEQILQKMDEIEAFAEIGEYFDQPVRVYSSGMQMRVAFAVATAFRPEILIVDEALSVGDSYFQHKSFDRIKQFQKEGTTLLIVSHDKSAIQALCNRAILLNNGSIIKDGDPEAIFDYYNAIIAEKEDQKIEIKQHESGKEQTISGNGDAVIDDIKMINSKNNESKVIFVGENVYFDIKVKVNKRLEQLVLGYGIKDRVGQVIYGTNTFHTKQILYDVSTGYIEYKIYFKANLGVGSYSVQTALTKNDAHIEDNYEWRDLALVFEVINPDDFFAGISYLPPKIEIRA
ncbi:MULTISPECIES: ABC transporter ATP-binding protein [unclassified Francisella]|uniref:ABC transporter ATP-binding protein n=1 Tax=unclassified Francisella TaxID=2610885 RepID=UPI002E2FB8D3|nr:MULTISPECIES: ABC transporter ATP-binding protein [unclassified Francisella]MED7819504.1 ABC transporter ATP-binding protein [Francisella sp. 19S2-4]MED7830293.1 ABC transporter ATP-binding protein [Francisella sp. 19S2-10]